VPLSLLDLLGGLIIVAITVALASNLPGLLEVLVLEAGSTSPMRWMKCCQ